MSAACTTRSSASSFGVAPNNCSVLSTPCKPPSRFKQWWDRNWDCVANVGLPTLADDLNPAGLGVGSLADASSQMSQASLMAAAKWSMDRGLTVPLRSPYVRAGMANAEAFGRASALLSLLAIDVGLIDAIHAEHVGCFK